MRGEMQKFANTKTSKLMEDSKTISLTKREKTILSEIAEKFGLSPETVKWYRKQMLVKFSAATSVEMIRKAVEKGML